MTLTCRGFATVTASQLGSGAPGRGDLLPCGVGESVRAHLEGDADVARAQHLDRQVRTHGPARDQLVRSDRAARGKQLGEPAGVDHLVLSAVAVVEALQLRQPHVDRHLAALEARGYGPPRPGALRATASGLALGALTAADTSLRGLGARCRTQAV